MRKFHQKTRRGCRQCKSRHIKCDEARPSCRRCGRADLPCSFVAEMPAPRPWNPEKPQTGSDANGKPDASLLQLGPGLWTRRALHDPPVRLTSITSQPFNMLHFRLFHYFEHDLSAFLEPLHPGFPQLAKLFIRNAVENHYLMEELLAYSAAHKSTQVIVETDRKMYLNEAMRLQTRALALYNGQGREVTEETCLPMFLYSSLLSHHIVFDVRLHMHDDLEVAISWLTHSIGIHRGLIELAQRTWPFLTEDTRNTLTRACHRDDVPIPSSNITGTECDSLLARLRISGLESPTIDHLCTTVEILQDRFSAAQPNNSHYTWAVIQDWLVAIPAGYVELLKERKPEALVVLSYFAVLLHHASPYWFVADLGARLARLISNHLGPAWADWLKWPNDTTGLVLPTPAPASAATHGTHGLLF